MTTPAPPKELWLLLKSHDAAVVDMPVKVSLDGCQDVHDFIKAIKKELSPDLDAVSVRRITLHLTEDSPALRAGLALSSVVTQPGFINDDESPLVVKTQLPISSNEGSTSF